MLFADISRRVNSGVRMLRRKSRGLCANEVACRRSLCWMKMRAEGFGSADCIVS
jgi:hypothetical protein